MMKNRITVGFHRAGLVAAFIITLLAIIISTTGNHQISEGLELIIFAVVVYVLFRAVAWVITGFMKDKG